jgi:GTPase
MKFIDEAIIFIKSGDGGAGHISFRREKGVPKGGPDGGTGGKGGNVIFYADPHLNTLLDFRYKRIYKAQDGHQGGKYQCTGKDGKDIMINVPVGTIIKTNDGEVLADLRIADKQIILAHGGNGGRGNCEFATPTNQTPRNAEPGWPGKEFEVQLELKLLADVGLVGLPNAGKSTLVSVISAAKPKIADYPFTTLTPNLGIVKIAENQSFVVADIPGLIEGASEGKGLGIQFLRHIERTKVLLFLVDSTGLDPAEDFRILYEELKKYSKKLLVKPRIICLTKVDAYDEDTKKLLRKIKFKGTKTPVMLISSVSGEAIDELKKNLWNIIKPEINDEI